VVFPVDDDPVIKIMLAAVGAGMSVATVFILALFIIHRRISCWGEDWFRGIVKPPNTPGHDSLQVGRENLTPSKKNRLIMGFYRFRGLWRMRALQLRARLTTTMALFMRCWHVYF
jgi:hypothetical protein